MPPKPFVRVLLVSCFTFAALATYGRTINFDLKRADGYKNFCNKLWNAARFAFLNLEGARFQPRKLTDLALEDRWILSRLQAAIAHE